MQRRPSTQQARRTHRGICSSNRAVDNRPGVAAVVQVDGQVEVALVQGDAAVFGDHAQLNVRETLLQTR